MIKLIDDVTRNTNTASNGATAAVTGIRAAAD